jgi:hypothetical protein
MVLLLSTEVKLRFSDCHGADVHGALKIESEGLAVTARSIARPSSRAQSMARGTVSAPLD